MYVRADPAAEPEREDLDTSDKGNPGNDLKSLLYVRSIQTAPRPSRKAAQGGWGWNREGVSREREEAELS